MKRIYIAGPMTGKPDLNFPLFHREAARLRAEGWHVENPAELCKDIAGQWNACMRRDLAALLKCEAILMLPGWEWSRGASLEHYIAQRLEMRVIYHQAEVTA
jgi:hypothetical protein